MSDDLTRIQPEDPNKININQEWELNYWINNLKVTKQKHIEAVKTVGSSVPAVRKYPKV